MAPPEPGCSLGHNKKRVRPFLDTESSILLVPKVSSNIAVALPSLTDLHDLHDLAYWCQWRLAIHEVCARFNAAAQAEADAWSRERVDHVIIAQHAVLSNEVQHLESQLGKYTSINGKLEAALSENAEALTKAKSARVAAFATASRLQAQASTKENAAAASARELEEKVARLISVQEDLEKKVRNADTIKVAAEVKVSELLRKSLSIEVELSEVRREMEGALEKSRAERVRVETAQADLASLREKFSTLKRRYVDAGRKVEAVRAERDALRHERATLEDKLADVEKFQSSERGRALDRMEQELASERMARVELEADRDDLQSQLAVALQTRP